MILSAARRQSRGHHLPTQSHNLEHRIMRDLHSNLDADNILYPQAKTTIAVQLGKVIDLKGYEGCELIFQYGSVTATNATLTPLVKDGDATGSLSSVADAYLVGTEAAAGIAAAATRTSGTSKNVTKRIGYIGTKRYITAGISSTVTAATLVAISVVRGLASRAPIAT
jgi:hypothetical protein